MGETESRKRTVHRHLEWFGRVPHSMHIRLCNYIKLINEAYKPSNLPVKMRIVWLLPVALLALQGSASPTQSRKTCIVKASGTNRTDDAPAIRAAFKDCGRHGKVVFEPTTYFVNSVLNITDLEDVDIDVQGELLVSQTVIHCYAVSDQAVEH